MLNTPVTDEYVQNLLEGLSGQLKGNLQPVQHQGEDPKNTRETAVKAMKKQIDDAKKSGKDVIYRVEGRDEEHQAGDPETEDRIRAYAKKQDVNYEEGSLEGETKAGGKKFKKLRKAMILRKEIIGLFLRTTQPVRLNLMRSQEVLKNGMQVDVLR
tara:strand:+ start:1142 stop:1609 length:468 start_codon:yes stop_codon:yes gene_type:complete